MAGAGKTCCLNHSTLSIFYRRGCCKLLEPRWTCRVLRGLNLDVIFWRAWDRTSWWCFHRLRITLREPCNNLCRDWRT